MVVQLFITELMISCFHSCVKEGNYKQLIDSYGKFFTRLECRLPDVYFEDPLHSTIAREFKFLRIFISTWDSSKAVPWNKEDIIPDDCISEFLEHLISAMRKRNFDDFYNKYLSSIDLLIQEARRQNIIDLKIGGLNQWAPYSTHDSFSQRDEAAALMDQEKKVGEEPHYPQNRRQIKEPTASRKPESSNHVTFSEPKKMVVQLVVTPAMIECFHECTRKCDYQQLFKDYLFFFKSLTENLGRVNFSGTWSLMKNVFYSAIVKESKFLLNFISTWGLSTEVSREKNINQDLYILGFFPRLVQAMRTKNWDDFYIQFLPTIDCVIEEARRQEIIDLRIAFEFELYGSFESRDKARNRRNQKAMIETPQSCDYLTCSESSLPIRENVPNEIPKASQPIPTEIPKIKESSSARVPEVHQTVPIRMTEVKGITNVPLEPYQVDLQEGYDRLKSVLQKSLKVQVDLFQDGTDRKHNDLGNLNIEENLKKNLKKHFDKQLYHINVSSNEMFSMLWEQLSTTRLELDDKIGEAMKISAGELSERLRDTVKQMFDARIATLESDLMEKMENQHRKSSNKPLEVKIKMIEEKLEREMGAMNLMKNGERKDSTQMLGIIDEKFEEQERKMKSREEKLERNMEDFKMREDLLNKKFGEIEVREESLKKMMVAEMERRFQEQMEQFKLKEKSEQKLNELVAKIEKNVQDLAGQLKLKEEILNRKIEEINVREVSLDRKMEEMIKGSFQERRGEFQLNEETMDRKIEGSLNVKLEAMIKRSVQEQKEQLILKEDLLNKRIQEISLREDTLNEKMEAAIRKSVQEQMEKLKLREDLVNKKFGETEALEKSLNKTMEAAIEKGVQEQKEQLKLKEDLLNKKMEEIIVSEDSLNKKMEAMIERNVHEHDEQLKLREETLDKKIEGIKVREELLNNKIKAEIEKSVQKQWAQNENSVNKNIVSLNDDITAMVERSVQEQKEQLKLKEDLLNKKTEEMKIREDSLDEKMEAAIRKSTQQQKEQLELKEEMLDGKIVEVKAKEELLDRKIDAMLELMELFKHQNQPKVAVAHCSKSSDDCSSGTGIKSTVMLQDKKEATDPGPRNCPSTLEPTSSRSPPIEGLSDDDEEIRQMQENFEKELAEQDAKNAAEMKEVKERGRQKNEKAQAEIRELSRSVSRARDRASFRL